MSYPAFADAMSTLYPTYQWEPIPVTTTDNYELTLFHVWNEEKRTELGP